MPAAPRAQVRAESMLAAMPNWSQAGHSAPVLSSGVRNITPPAVKSATKKAPVPARSSRSTNSSCSLRRRARPLRPERRSVSRSSRKPPNTSSAKPANTSRKRGAEQAPCDRRRRLGHVEGREPLHVRPSDRRRRRARKDAAAPAGNEKRLRGRAPGLCRRPRFGRQLVARSVMSMCGLPADALRARLSLAKRASCPAGSRSNERRGQEAGGRSQGRAPARKRGLQKRRQRFGDKGPHDALSEAGARRLRRREIYIRPDAACAARHGPMQKNAVPTRAWAVAGGAPLHRPVRQRRRCSAMARSVIRRTARSET